MKKTVVVLLSLLLLLGVSAVYACDGSSSNNNGQGSTTSYIQNGNTPNYLFLKIADKALCPPKKKADHKSKNVEPSKVPDKSSGQKSVSS